MSNVAFLQYRVTLKLSGVKYIHHFPTWESASKYAAYYLDSVNVDVTIQSQQVGPWANEPLA